MDKLGLSVDEVLHTTRDYQQVALMPVAYTKGAGFKPVKRPPLETVVRWDS